MQIQPFKWLDPRFTTLWPVSDNTGVCLAGMAALQISVDKGRRAKGTVGDVCAAVT